MGLGHGKRALHSALRFAKGDLTEALGQLERFSEGAAFLLGHNLIAFDAPHLEAARPDLRLLRLPRIDTLRLNPLAFPRNPYHHLAKQLSGRGRPSAAAGMDRARPWPAG